MNEPMIERVLVVDDDDVDRETTVRLLARAVPRVQVDEAQDAQEALRLIDSRTYDCILLDYYMPDTSGMEMLPELKHRMHTRPMGLIMMSGRRDERVAREALKLGFHDYLTKEKIEPQAFVSTLSNAVALARRESGDGSPSDPA